MANNLILEEDYNNKSDQVSSRFMNLNQRKYLLAGVNQSVEQLNSQQVDVLTKLLISLKSEYDNLIREVNKKKSEMEKITKQSMMLERMENKFKGKVAELEDQGQSYEMNLHIQKKRYDEELYAKTSYSHLIERMKEDLHVIRMEINTKEHQSLNIYKALEKEKMREAAIKIELNKIHSHIEQIQRKNEMDKNEKDLIIKYYKTIISQKKSFIDGADERKLNQERIAEQAKNDTQDKQEVEKRKVLNLCKVYNKFLRKKIESQLKDNEELEKTFQKIKAITGISNLKVIVDKILNKDKDYNNTVSKVTEKEYYIDSLKTDIKNLEEEYKKLRNNCKSNPYLFYYQIQMKLLSRTLNCKIKSKLWMKKKRR